MNQNTRIALYLMGELVAALRANDSDLFKRWLYGGIEDPGEPAVTEPLLLTGIQPTLTAWFHRWGIGGAVLVRHRWSLAKSLQRVIDQTGRLPQLRDVGWAPLPRRW